MREDVLPENFDPKQRRRELIISLGLVSLVFATGTIGYMVIEGWSAFDSLYMTVITLATIGYGETHPLSDGGRAFTMLLIIVGLGIGTVVLGSAWQAAVENQIFRLFDRRRKVLDTIQALDGHTIFCGFSRLGRVSAEELRKSGEKIVIVELNEIRAREAEASGFLVIRGDATLDETLTAAGLKRAGRLISLLPRDSDNLYVILTAREINPSLYIVSRAEDEVGEKRLKRAGVDRLISTYRLAARKLADGLLRPYVTDFFEIAGTGDNGWKIEEIRIPRTSPICGKTLGDLALRQRSNVSIAAIINPEGQLQLNPGGDSILSAESTLLAIGWDSDIKTLEKLVIGV
jgi:voltage-gated potassium channel